MNLPVYTLRERIMGVYLHAKHLPVYVVVRTYIPIYPTIACIYPYIQRGATYQ